MDLKLNALLPLGIFFMVMTAVVPGAILVSAVLLGLWLSVSIMQILVGEDAAAIVTAGLIVSGVMAIVLL